MFWLDKHFFGSCWLHVHWPVPFSNSATGLPTPTGAADTVTTDVYVRSVRQSHNSCVTDSTRLKCKCIHLCTWCLLNRLSDHNLVSYQWERGIQKLICLGHKSHLAIVVSTFGHWVVLYCHLLRGCLIPCLTSPWWTAGAPQASGRCLHETCQMSTSCLAGSSGPGVTDEHTCLKRAIHSALSTKLHEKLWLVLL